jgi:hypothetical protein
LFCAVGTEFTDLPRFFAVRIGDGAFGWCGSTKATAFTLEGACAGLELASGAVVARVRARLGLVTTCRAVKARSVLLGRKFTSGAFLAAAVLGGFGTFRRGGAIFTLLA